MSRPIPLSPVPSDPVHGVSSVDDQVSAGSFQRSQRICWEKAYSSDGALWKGPAGLIPDIAPMSRVLEMGCGNGKTLSALARMDIDIVAIDFSKVAVRSCEGIAGTHPDLVIADASSLPFADESFNAIIAVHVLGHMDMEGRKNAVKEIIRSLRVGGKLFLRDFSVNDMRAGIGREIEERTFVKGNGISCHFFDLSEIRSMFYELNVVSVHEETTKKRMLGKDYTRAEMICTFIKRSEID